ncbi:MAG: hypothetical protein F6J93_22265 [Oscillatoria sp. SIO1A7]|nr:hypothetical protein [Oscillatoria sp. SIO1A7]
MPNAQAIAVSGQRSAVSKFAESLLLLAQPALLRISCWAKPAARWVSFFAQCPMPNAQCPIPNAPFPIPHAQLRCHWFWR